MIIKQLAKLFGLVFLGLLGGVLGGLAAFSYLAGLLPFNADEVKNLAPVRITERQEVTIQENKALKDAVAKVVGAVIGIKVTTVKGAVTYGSGMIISSDGMAVLPFSLFGSGTSAQVIAGGKTVKFEVVKRDKKQNLVILKLENSNWPTAGFYQLDNLKLGERVFVAGMLSAGGNFVNEGVVRDFDAEAINTTINEKSEALGAPVFDIEGNILGIAEVAKTGQVSVISISRIKEFSGL
ncbi:MAG: trypsin-like peptidase domain-containing protein [Candidatus Paceibacterota bacterium]